MNLRDRLELVIRAWDKYEATRSSPAVIDYDCLPTVQDIEGAPSRVWVYRQLQQLSGEASETGQQEITDRIDADLAYVEALLGRRSPLDEYVKRTQGCHTSGWPEEYVQQVRDRTVECLDSVGLNWGPNTAKDLERLEEPIDATQAADAIARAAEEFEPHVRKITGATAKFDLSIEPTEVDDYWSYWLDGAGNKVRLRLNLRNARFTKVRARQFALHEILGHGLQSSNFAERCANEDVPWVRLMSVHAQQQVLLEGLAQTLPLFAVPNDKALATRVRLDHYLELVRGELHLAINGDATVGDCVRHAKSRVPFWDEEDIADELSDRGRNPLLRSYLWAYVAGIDWFISLSESSSISHEEVLHAAYRTPLTPSDLSALWPTGPTIGGPGGAVRLR